MSQSPRRPPAEPVLATDRDLDDQQVTDVAIGLTDGPGGRFRALQRLRTTVRNAVVMAGRTAQVLAGASQETLLDPHCRPSAIRIADDGEEGARILLDYDVGGRGDSREESGRNGALERRTRVSRPLRLVMIARESSGPRPIK